MNIIFWGTPLFSVNTLQALIDSEHEIKAVVTQPDKKRGRGNKKSPSPVKQEAINNNIPVFTTSKISTDDSLVNQLKLIKPDLFVVVAFGQILPNYILKIPTYGCWNSHASLLPRWRGAGPIQWSLLNGDKATGVSVMYMEETLDTGPILLMDEISINLLDNFEIISDKLSLLSAQLILKSIGIIQKQLADKKYINSYMSLLVQQDTKADTLTYARMISKVDYMIQWDNQAINIHRKIMALYPGAYTYINGKRLRILQSIPLILDYKEQIPLKIKNLLNLIGNNRANPGEIYSIEKNIGIIVGTKDNLILITEAQLEGKKRTSSNSLIQQLNINVGQLFTQN